MQCLEYITQKFSLTSLCQLISGAGNPVALHTNLTVEPFRTVKLWLGCTLEITGGTERKLHLISHICESFCSCSNCSIHEGNFQVNKCQKNSIRINLFLSFFKDIFSLSTGSSFLDGRWLGLYFCKYFQTLHWCFLFWTCSW